MCSDGEISKMNPPFGNQIFMNILILPIAWERKALGKRKLFCVKFQ